MSINLIFMVFVLDADIVRRETMRPAIALHIRRSFHRRYGTQKVRSVRILRKENNHLQRAAVSDDRWFFCTEKWRKKCLI